MHPKNIHKQQYNLDELIKSYPLLKDFVFINKYQTKTIDFANPKAVKALNTSLLKHHYHINYWNFPDNNLCPPIPSRVDYIHYLAELISLENKNMNILDIGTGATCIYPLLGNAIYHWNFIGSDIDNKSIENSKKIALNNKLENQLSFRLQANNQQILKGIIKPNEYFDAVMCNPPFYKSEKDAVDANLRKSKNLKLQLNIRNFSGNANELWYKGGEKAFINNYLFESVFYKKQVGWFTSLVSKKELIKDLKRTAKKLSIPIFKVIEMNQGNKKSTVIAWKF